MEDCKIECNVLEYAISVKAIATAGLYRRLTDYAAFVAVSVGADVGAGQGIIERHETAIDAVKAAADAVVDAFGRIALADDEVVTEAERNYEAAVAAFADVLAAYVCETSPAGAREFDLVRWEVEDPQPVTLA